MNPTANLATQTIHTLGQSQNPFPNERMAKNKAVRRKAAKAAKVARRQTRLNAKHKNGKRKTIHAFGGKRGK